MGRIEKTVFISYRRTNVPWALAIYQNLTMHGYDVFIDYESIPSGSFEKVILENIRTRAHFLVILTPSALERCNEPGDWLRREIETAMDEHRNIVPLMLESFDFGSPLVKEALTGKLGALNAFNGLRVYSEYFFPAMDKLRSQFLNVELSDVAIPELTIETKQITGAQKTAANEAKLVEKEQLTAQEWFERGYIFQQAKDFDEAVRCYSEAIRLEPEFLAAYGNRGISYRGRGNFEQAIADYNQVLKFNPLDAKAYSNLGIVLSSQRRNNEAETTFRKSIELNPSDPKTFNGLGNVLRREKRYHEAETAYRKAIELDPSYIGVYHNLGNLLLIQKRYDEAVVTFRKAIELDPSQTRDYLGLVISLRKSNQNEVALDVLKELIGRAPEDARFHIMIASINKEMGNIISDQQIVKTRRLIPEKDWYNRACLESVCDDFDLAFEYLQQAVDNQRLDRAWSWEDPDLQWIRDDPRFEQIIGPRPE
jgi:tetratricopeptide (TPR) repeat protein